MSVNEDFIRAEIVTGHSMLKLAYNEVGLGDLDASNRAINNAKLALVTAKRYLPLIVVSANSARDLTNGIEELERTIDQFEQGIGKREKSQSNQA